MASDGSPSREGAKKKSKKKRDHKEVKGRRQKLIEELTESGHVALQRGQNQDALDCFKKAYKASIQVTHCTVLEPAPCGSATLRG